MEEKKMAEMKIEEKEEVTKYERSEKKKKRNW